MVKENENGIYIDTKWYKCIPVSYYEHSPELTFTINLLLWTFTWTYFYHKFSKTKKKSRTRRRTEYLYYIVGRENRGRTLYKETYFFFLQTRRRAAYHYIKKKKRSLRRLKTQNKPIRAWVYLTEVRWGYDTNRSTIRPEKKPYTIPSTRQKNKFWSFRAPAKHQNF
jgi:hypothetical protein